jgi:hypothetical protein
MAQGFDTKQDPGSIELGEEASQTAIMTDEYGNEERITIDSTVDDLSGDDEAKEQQYTIAPAVYPCVGGYVKIGSSRLCLTTGLYGPSRYRYADYICRNRHHGGRIADATDYYTVNQKLGGAAFHNYAISGIWLGPRTADNRALYLNLVRWWDMDGETSVYDFRYYRCAYDL